MIWGEKSGLRRVPRREKVLMVTVGWDMELVKGTVR